MVASSLLLFLDGLLLILDKAWLEFNLLFGLRPRLLTLDARYDEVAALPISSLFLPETGLILLQLKYFNYLILSVNQMAGVLGFWGSYEVYSIFI